MGAPPSGPWQPFCVSNLAQPASAFPVRCSRYPRSRGRRRPPWAFRRTRAESLGRARRPARRSRSWQSRAACRGMRSRSRAATASSPYSEKNSRLVSTQSSSSRCGPGATGRIEGRSIGGLESLRTRYVGERRVIEADQDRLIALDRRKVVQSILPRVERVVFPTTGTAEDDAMRPGRVVPRGQVDPPAAPLGGALPWLCGRQDWGRARRYWLAVRLGILVATRRLTDPHARRKGHRFAAAGTRRGRNRQRKPGADESAVDASEAIEPALAASDRPASVTPVGVPVGMPAVAPETTAKLPADATPLVEAPLVVVNAPDEGPVTMTPLAATPELACVLPLGPTEEARPPQHARNANDIRASHSATRADEPSPHVGSIGESAVYSNRTTKNHRAYRA